MANHAFLADVLPAGRLVQVIDEVLKTDLGYHLVVLKMRDDQVVLTVSRWIWWQLT